MDARVDTEAIEVTFSMAVRATVGMVFLAWTTGVSTPEVPTRPNENQNVDEKSL